MTSILSTPALTEWHPLEEKHIVSIVFFFNECSGFSSLNRHLQLRVNFIYISISIHNLSSKRMGVLHTMQLMLTAYQWLEDTEQLPDQRCSTSSFFLFYELCWDFSSHVSSLQSPSRKHTGQIKWDYSALTERPLCWLLVSETGKQKKLLSKTAQLWLTCHSWINEFSALLYESV